MAHAVNLMFRNVLLGPDALHRQQRILWTPIAFFANPRFFAPQIAVNRVALRDFVIAETLGKAHPAATIRELAQHCQYLPLQVGWRLLLRIIEKYFVLDLQPTKLRFEEGHFLVDGHAFTSD